jgi:uridine kinase
MRAERSIIPRQTALGAYACDKDEALGRLTAAAAGRSVTPRTPAA